MQNATAPQAPAAPQTPQAPELPRTQQGGDGSDLGAQIRKQIHDQMRAQQEQLRAAQEQAGAERQAQYPGTGFPPPPPVNDPIPPQAVELVIAFFIMLAVIAIGKPIARAFARRLEQKPVQHLDAGLAAQLQRIEQSVDAMAIEVERISEAQRYMARLQSERAEAVGLPRQGSGS